MWLEDQATRDVWADGVMVPRRGAQAGGGQGYSGLTISVKEAEDPAVVEL